MSVEVVLLIPVLFLMTLLVVAGGRYVAAKSDVDAAARDAARAASMERTADDARAAARRVAELGAGSGSECRVEHIDPQFRPGNEGGHVTVRLRCEVSHSGLGLIGLHGTYTMRAESRAPLDSYRRIG